MGEYEFKHMNFIYSILFHEVYLVSEKLKLEKSITNGLTNKGVVALEQGDNLRGNVH